MRSLLTFFIAVALFFLASFSLSAQRQGTITGTLQDEQDNEPVIGAVIGAARADGASVPKFQSSTLGGKFTLSGLPYGEYDLTITFLGYDTLVHRVALNRPTFDVGVLRMRQSAREIDEVVVTGMAMRTSARGDTLIYNADAFKVSQDASTEQLLSKMPGITVSDGQVEAHGETVRKVTVDGKEFFGDDVTTAIRNLPAEVIDKVEVFNRQSDQAEFSGVDDGEDYRALNFITRNQFSGGSFGRFYAGYGFTDKYNAGVSYSLFNDKRRFSVIGMANNVNQQNFASEDILGVMGGSTGGGGGMRRGRDFMVRGSGGISTVYSLGVNYSEQFSEKVKLDASYFFNTNKTETLTQTDRTYTQGQDDYQFYEALSERNSRNYNHRLNARLDYRIDSVNSLMWRPDFGFQTNRNRTTDTSATYLSSSTLEQALINFLTNNPVTHTEGYNISNTLIYMHRFGGRPGRVLTTFFNTSFNKNDGRQDNYSLTRYYDPDTGDENRSQLLDQRINNMSKGYRLSGNVTYNEPVSERSQLLFGYQISYNYSDRDKRAYDKTYDPWEPQDEYSNTYNSGYVTHRVGPGYRYNHNRSTVVANVYYQSSTLTGNQIYPTIADPKTSVGFNNVTYMAMANLQFNPSTTLRVNLNSYTNNPSITQLQDVLDISNPLFLSQGNPALRPVYAHRLNLNFVKANVAKGRTFIVSAGGSAQSNYIANSVQRPSEDNFQVINAAGEAVATLDEGQQYSQPVNLNGYWNVFGVVNYGAPLKFISSNLNVNTRVNYAVLPGVYNLTPNKTKTISYLGGATLGSNISENLDFTFSYTFGYNVARNAQRAESNNEYLNQVATGRVKWVTWAGITLQVQGDYYYYKGITDDFRDDLISLNASVGKKIFRNRRGEINVSVNNLLDRNQRFTPTVTDAYRETVTTNMLGRYFSINFIYNLRRFGGQNVDAMPERGATQERPPGSRGGYGPGSGGPPMGPPRLSEKNIR